MANNNSNFLIINPPPQRGIWKFKFGGMSYHIWRGDGYPLCVGVYNPCAGVVTSSAARVHSNIGRSFSGDPALFTLFAVTVSPPD